MKFQYPQFLLALVAVAVPIVIHLLQLRKPKRVLFTNTAFIKQIELVTVQHRKIQHLLLLLTRTLAISALVLMFCQPFIPAEREAGGGRNGVGVFVDNSFSMQVPGNSESSLFQEAILNARKLESVGEKNSRLKLSNSGAGSASISSYHAGLDELKLSAHVKLPSGMVDKASADYQYIISDFQKSVASANFISGLDSSRQVVLVPLKGNATANIYVDSVWVDDAFVRLNTNVGLHVRLRNGGDAELKDCSVKVFLGEKQVAVFRVTLAAGQIENSVVQVQLQDAAVALGRVVTEDAPVVFDNTYYFTLQPAAIIRILEIGAEPVAQQLYANEPLFSYAHAKPERIDYGVLRQANMVLVRGVGAVDAGLRAALQNVVRRGGSVVVVPSPLAAAQGTYQQLFKELGVGTAQWEAVGAVPELREVATPTPQEPFFRDVFGARQRSQTMPRVAPVLRWARTGKDILRLRDGESYLANFASGAGQVYVFSAPFEKAYSDFREHALFVPVMYRLAMLSYRDAQLPAYRLTQGTLALKLPADQPVPGTVRADETPVRLVKDSLTLIPGQRTVGAEVQLSLPASMEAAGFYQVRRRNKVLATLAFNQGKQESTLAAYSAAELRQLIGPNRPNIQVVEAGVGGAGLAGFRAEQTGQPLWRYCLALALACLLAEALLVRFGARRAAPVQVGQAA